MYTLHGGRMAAQRRLWSLREDVLVEITDDRSEVTVLSSWGEFHLADPSPTVRQLLQRMTMGPVSLTNIIPGLDLDDIATVALEPEWSRVDAVLEQLSSCVVHSLAFDDTGELVLSAMPLERRSRLRVLPVDATTPLRLSRFTSIRSYDGVLVIESALAQYRVRVHWAPAAWIASSLGTPRTVQDLAELHDLAAPVVGDVIAYLVAAGMVLVADKEGGEPESGNGGARDADGEAARPSARRAHPPRFSEDADPGLSMWPYHELMFHVRTRMAQEDPPYGTVAHYRDQVPTLPAVKPLPPGPSVPLARSAGRRRRGAAELTLEVLGELLHRAASVRSVETVGRGEITDEISRRPYPSSLGLYELELYLAVDHCHGLDPGIYHYDPLGHTLTLINSLEGTVVELLDDAQGAAGVGTRPAVLMMLTSRIGRLSRHLCNYAYASTLRHVGLLQGTLLCVANALGLVSHPGPPGNAELTVDALRLDWPTEVNVGEFVLS